MHKHARRNRFLLALFFGVLSGLFGASAAQAAPPTCTASFTAWDAPWTITCSDLPANGGIVWVSDVHSPSYPGTYNQGNQGIECWAADFGMMSSSFTDSGDDNQLKYAGTNGVKCQTRSDTLDENRAPHMTAGTYYYTDGDWTSSAPLNAPIAAPPSGDPLNGAGFKLVGDTVNVFTTYIVPSVVLVLIAVYAFRTITRLSTRLLNRA